MLSKLLLNRLHYKKRKKIYKFQRQNVTNGVHIERARGELAWVHESKALTPVNASLTWAI